MKKSVMKKSLSAALAVLALAMSLSACAPPPIVLTPEQLNQTRLSTLMIYDDNSVAVRVLRPSKRSNYFDYEEGGSVFEKKTPILKVKSEDYIAWNENKDEALVYSTGSEYFNAKDLDRIVKDAGGMRTTFYLKNGKNRSFVSATMSILWCNRDKQCTPTNSGGMRALYENQLDTAEKYKTSFKLASGRDVLPVVMESEIDVLNDAEFAQLVARTRRVLGGSGSNLAKANSPAQLEAFHQEIMTAINLKRERDAQDRKDKKKPVKACPASIDWAKHTATVLVMNGCDPVTVERYFTRTN
jgi:hypothetical protein